MNVNITETKANVHFKDLKDIPFKLINAAVHTKRLPHQVDAWNWLQQQIDHEIVLQFKVKFRNDERYIKNPEDDPLKFSLIRAAEFTKVDIPHQLRAWDWLQSQIKDEKILTEFKARYRNVYRVMSIRDQHICPQQALEIVKEFEGFRANPYKCSAGVWTIGYGTTKYLDGTPVTPNDPPITEPAALELLVKQIETEYLPTLGRSVPYWYAMNGNKKSALISFAYNLGKDFMTVPDGFETLQRVLKAKEWEKIPQVLLLYKKAGGKDNAGLLRRRQAEGDLWMGTGKFARALD